MIFTISEMHFICKNLIARREWLEDNYDDPSEEQDEKEHVKSIINKIESVKFEFNEEGKK